MENKRNKKQIAIALIALIIIVAGMSLLYMKFKPKAVEGSKNIEVEVIFDESTSKSYSVQTDVEYLREALKPLNLLEGTESEYGLYVTTVDGKVADEGKQEWWCFTLGGETINTSVDSTPIKDGDHFEITLKTGW